MTNEKPINVVVVDDDPETLALVLVKLKDHPRIKIAGTGHSGREAIQLANTLKPDVMVLDVMMPILNGLEAAARIAAVFPSIGLLMLTSDASPESIRAALRAGAKDYLDKSTELYRLADAVLAVEASRQTTAVSDRGLASVWAFYSAKGSAGGTTLAVAAAYELAKSGRKVILIDLDMLHGDVAFYLNLTPGQFNIFTHLTAGPQAEATTLQPFLKRWKPADSEVGAFDVLQSPSEYVHFDAQGEESLIGLMDILITTYDYVIVDMPPGRVFDGQNIAVLDFAERLFFIANRDMPSLRSLLSFHRALQRTTVRVARFNLLFASLRVQNGEFDYQDWLKKSGLPLTSFEDVPVDDETASKAVASGLPIQLADPDSAIAQFVYRMVEIGKGRDPGEVQATGGQPKKLWNAFKKILGG